MDLVPDTLLPQRLLRVATSPPLFSSLSSYRHSINLFLVFACPTSTSFTPDDMQFVPLSIKPIRSSSPSIHCSIFFLFPSLPLRHISQSRNLPLPSIHYFFSSFLLLITNKNVAPKALSYFLHNQARPHTQRKSKHPLRGLSMYLFPPVVFISHRQKKGYRVCVGV